MTIESTTVLLTVRGTLAPSTLEAARELHNATAGSERGIEAARSLGDLSHKVYAPAPASAQSSAKPGELLFVDVWVDAGGIQSFFSNPEVQKQGGALFGGRDATVWMPGRGAYAYTLPTARGREERAVGLVRGPIADPEKAIAIFREVDAVSVRDARRRGILSHQLFIKLAPPGEPLELLGLDTWSDVEGMAAHYADATHMKPLGAAFSGKADVSVWTPAAGAWSEW